MNLLNRVCQKSVTKGAAPQVKTKMPSEVKVVTLRECPVEKATVCNPAEFEKFWRATVETSPQFNRDHESLWVFLLNVRKRVICFQQLSQGTKNSLLVNIGEVFRLASLKNAAGIFIAHNHPSGDPSPSTEDVLITLRLINAAKILGFEFVDHLILGDPNQQKSYASLRELGHFDPDDSQTNLTDTEKKNLISLADTLRQVVLRFKVLDHLSADLEADRRPQEEQFENRMYGQVLLQGDVLQKLEAITEDIFQAAYGQKGEVTA